MFVCYFFLSERFYTFIGEILFLMFIGGWGLKCIVSSVCENRDLGKIETVIGVGRSDIFGYLFLFVIRMSISFLLFFFFIEFDFLVFGIF